MSFCGVDLAETVRRWNEQARLRTLRMQLNQFNAMQAAQRALVAHTAVQEAAPRSRAQEKARAAPQQPAQAGPSRQAQAAPQQLPRAQPTRQAARYDPEVDPAPDELDLFSYAKWARKSNRLGEREMIRKAFLWGLIPTQPERFPDQQRQAMTQVWGDLRINYAPLVGTVPKPRDDCPPPPEAPVEPRAWNAYWARYSARGYTDGQCAASWSAVNQATDALLRAQIYANSVHRASLRRS